ncbi:neuronal acetylcholine receptor subunit beta-3-like isoform X3 [Mercenaria mercenaria]|uniref:neuronal acetylcholine receptor subunit beta-3-like isoform X3 n=1 Tax=Mercenaria mercenaria TaxID=6596 RepID=UPI00234EBD56|nr:neuronal acetylcholine receptor subunit beta-3-like isoform X3 [Mercenaria mercenaria]
MLFILTLMFELFIVVKGIPKGNDLGSTETLADVHTKLLQTILKGYDKRIVPQINDSIPVSLSIGIRLIDLVDLFEHEEIMETRVYIQQLWTDFRLSWDPSRFKRIHVINIPVEELWQPDVSLFNNAEIQLETMNTLAIVFSNGHVFYSPKARIRTRCQMDMTSFPYDQQFCSIKFGSYTYDGNKINLTMYHENSTFDLSEYSVNKEWHLTASPATIFTKRYDCCPEPYQHIQFNLNLQRKAVYYTHVFILPAVVVAILVPFQFLLPPDCRERLTIGSTLMLGIVVLIAMIQNFLPEAHPNLPYLVQYYCLTMIWFAISMVLSIWAINTQNRGPRKRKVPGIIRQLFLKTLKKIVCVNEDSYHPLDDTETISFKSIDKQTVTNSADGKHDGNKLERDVDEILKQVNVLVVRSVIAESRRNVRTEWYQVVLVFDRIMCLLFLLVFVVYSCVLLG